MIELNKIYNEDCLEGMKRIPDKSVDLTVTSPPYDNLRTYNGFSWDFEGVANELYRVTKDGSVVVWIVGDSTVDGGESLTSFRQALYFKDLGFAVETMIWEKPTFTATGALRYRYGQVFEYMFVFVKGRSPKTFNPLKDRLNKSFGDIKHGTVRQVDGTTKEISSKGKPIPRFGQRFNVWRITPEKSNRFGKHPAPFPTQLIEDHIVSWSNENDIVLDPFMGSGTTAIAAINTERNFIGFELNKEYFDIAQNRIEERQNEISLLDVETMEVIE